VGDLNTENTEIVEDEFNFKMKAGFTACSNRMMKKIVSEIGQDKIKSRITNDFNHLIDWVISSIDEKVSLCLDCFSQNPTINQ
jgi:hypothetical protein